MVCVYEAHADRARRCRSTHGWAIRAQLNNITPLEKQFGFNTNTNPVADKKKCLLSANGCECGNTGVYVTDLI